MYSDGTHIDKYKSLGITWHSENATQKYHAYMTSQAEMFSGAVINSVCKKKVLSVDSIPDTETNNGHCLSCVKLLDKILLDKV